MSDEIISENRFKTQSDIKSKIRREFVVGLYLVLLTFGFVYYFLKSRQLEQRVNYLVALPLPTPEYVYVTPAPTTPLPSLKPVTSQRETIEMAVPIFLDDPLQKENYAITFSKISSNLAYYITSDNFPKLVISDKDFTFTLQIPREGFNQPYNVMPKTERISTNQFGTLTKIYDIEPKAGDMAGFYYSSDFDTLCTQHQPTPKACSFNQVRTKTNNLEISAYVRCEADGEGESKCDQLISSLTVKLKE